MKMKNLQDARRIGGKYIIPLESLEKILAANQPYGKYRSLHRNPLSLRNLLMNSIHRQRKKVRRPMKLMSSKQDYPLKRNMAIALSVGRLDTLPKIVQKGRKRLLRRI